MRKAVKTGWVIISLILVAVLIIFYIYNKYRVETNDLIDDEKFHLRTISDYKIQQIASWRRERIADANTLTSNLNFIRSIDHLVSDPSNISEAQFIRSRCEAYVNFKDYQLVLLMDLDGNKIVEYPTATEQLSPEVIDNAKKSLSGTQSIMGDFIYCSYHQEPHLDVYIPIFRNYSARSNPIAIMLFRTKSYEFFNNNIIVFPILTETGESYIVKVVSDSIRFLTNTRFDKNAALRRIVPAKRKNILKL